MTNMYKKISLALLVTTGLFATKANAQLATGSITIGITPNYATIASAIDSLNVYGVTVPTTINIPAGYTEIAPVGGFKLTATGTAANTITIQKLGAGINPLINAYAGGTATPSSISPDGVFKLIGSDYVTIDGIDIKDNNTTNPSTMEHGYGIFKASVIDGAQYNTIKNCVITLNRINNAASTSPMVEGSVGIEVLSSTATAATTILTPTNATGSNSYNTFSNNTIQNCNYGVAIIGFAAATPFAVADYGNKILSNTIINFGGGAATSPSAAIRTLAQYDLQVNLNTIDNNKNGTGVNHATTFRGIFINTATSASATINGNNIKLKSGATTTAFTAIDNASGGTAAGNTISITNNIIDSVAFSAATTATFNGIINSATAATVNINGNTIRNATTLAGTGTMILISAGSPTTLNVNNNTITNITRTSASTGILRCIVIASPTTSFINNNTIDGVRYSNVLSTGNIDGIYTNSSDVTFTVIGNTIKNLATPTTGTIIGIRNFGSAGAKTIMNNAVSDFSTTTGGVGGATFTGMSFFTGNVTIKNNTIFNLNSTGTTGGTGGAIVGVQLGSATTDTIAYNKIYNLSSASTGVTVAGLSVAGGTTNNIYNNVIGDLRATAATSITDVVRGINITATAVGVQNVYYNSIYLNATSTGANFSTTGVWHTTSATANVATLNLNNNVIVNKSTPMGTGVTSALRRSSATITNFGTTSNNNMLYVDTTLANRATLYDGTVQTQGLSAYKTLVTPREASCKTENPDFVSTVGANANFLQFNTATPTFAESGATNIGGITNDFGGAIRQGNAGYTGTGASPDMGAHEFNGISNLPLCSGTPAIANTVAPSASACSGAAFGLSLSTNYSATAGIIYQWQSSPDSITFTNIASATNATYTASQTTTMYYQCVITCTNSTMSVTSAAVKVNVSSFLNCYCTTTYSSGCGTTDHIANVKYATINNTTVCASGNTYTTNPTVYLGATDTLKISVGSDASQYTGVWFDFNQDGDFTDAGEYFANAANAGANGTLSYLITIPATATLGTTMMRIRGGNDTPLANTPCGVSSSNFGETENYLVTLACPTMAGPSTTNAFICTGNTATLTATANNAGMLKWYTDSVGGTLIKTGASYTTSTLSADTTLWVQETIGASCTSPRIKVKVNITQVTVALNPVNVQCNGGNNGSFTLGTVTCGTAPFTYSVNGGAFGAIPTNLVAGTYTIVANDAAALSSGPITVVVTQPTWTVNNPTATNLVVCEGTTIANLIGSANLNPIATGSQVLTFGLAAQPLEVGASSVSPVITTTPNIIATATMSALPAGAVITNVKLTMPNLTATGSSWASDVFLGLTGAVNTSYAKDSLAPSTTLNNPFNFNYAKYFTPTSSTITGGAVNLHYFESYPTDNAGSDCTFPIGAAVATLTINYTYNIPANVTWWDSLSGGALLVANDTLNAVGTTVLPNTLTAGVYKFYAQADNAGCYATARTLTTVTVNAKATTPLITASGPTTFCVGDSVQLTSSIATLNTWNNAATTAGIKVKTSGTYYSITNNANGCKSDTSNKITVVVNTLPVAPIITASANVITCNTPSVTLKATNYSTGLVWSNAATTDSLVLTSKGTFSATHTNANGCKSPVSNMVVITDSLNSNFTLNTATPNDSICLGGSVTLSVTGLAGGLAYMWTPVATLNIGAGTTVTATPTLPTTYSVTSDNGVGCMTTKTITITPITPPTVTVMGDSAICAGVSATLTASGATSYAWTGGPATATNVVIPTTTTTYKVIGTNAFGCADTAIAVINVNALPVAPIISASSPEINCTITSSTLSASNYTTGLSWSNGDVTPTSTTSIAGTFTATVTDANGCVSTVSNAVVVTNNTGITFTVNNPTPNDSVCVGAAVNLGATGTGLTYTWGPVGTLSDTIGSNVTATIAAGATTYTVIADNGAGCTLTKTVTITGVPNAVVMATAASPVVTVTNGNILNLINVTGATTFDFTSSVTGVATHTILGGTALTGTINDSIGATTGGNGTVDYVITGYNEIGCPSAPVMITVNISSVVALANQTIDANLNIYPNPTASVLNIAVKANTLNVTMFDMNGKVVKQANVNGNTTQLTVSDLASGTYSLRITTEAGTTVKKVTVTKE